VRASLAVITSVALLLGAGSAAASPTYPAEIQSHLGLSYTPPCAICHEGGRGGTGTVTTAFGRAMMDRGLHASDPAALDAALDKMAADGVDSDGDGTPDIEQLKQGRDPNGATGVAIGAPPVEYGCGALTIAGTRAASAGNHGWLFGVAVFGVVLSRRRRRLGPLVVAAVVGFASCNPYHLSYVAPEVCQSGRLWTGGTSGDEQMNPGLACIECHSRGSGPRFSIAGTVFASSDEKDKCAGSNGADVYVTGADGRTLKLVPNDVGNFFTRNSVPFPYSAFVQTADGKQRRMTATQSNGDCNSCHTQHGDNGAPGRIVVP
jgi:hypothetical protein